MSQGANILNALKERLETITVANGYPLSVKTVRLNNATITFDVPVTSCPLIEIIQGPEEYQHAMGGQVDVTQSVIIRLVHAKGKTDADMEEFKSSVVRALYADSYAGNSNGGINLSSSGRHNLNMLRLIRCETDLNLLEKNRIYGLLFELKSNRQTWSF
jgi:hypothetical protein